MIDGLAWSWAVAPGTPPRMAATDLGHLADADDVADDAADVERSFYVAVGVTVAHVRADHDAGHAAAVVGVTLWIIAAFAMVGDPVVHTLAERLLDTSWAAALVLAAAWLDQGINRSISVEMRN